MLTQGEGLSTGRSLAVRVCAAEVMDQPGLGEVEHRCALAGLARLNYVSRSVGTIWPSILAAARRTDGPLRILDLATGGGDLPLGLWRRARQFGLSISTLGVDISAQAIEIAQQRAQRASASIQFATLDVLNDPLPTGFDIITASLFLHHLEDEQALDLLARMAAAARQAVIVNDLVRGRGNLFLVALGARLLTTSRVVWTDASLSVRAAFTIEELRRLAVSAGMREVRISRRFPCRMLLEWRKV